MNGRHSAYFIIELLNVDQTLPVDVPCIKEHKSTPKDGKPEKMKPPFANYGCADKRQDFGMKRTHNVNATPRWVRIFYYNECV